MIVALHCADKPFKFGSLSFLTITVEPIDKRKPKIIEFAGSLKFSNHDWLSIHMLSSSREIKPLADWHKYTGDVMLVCFENTNSRLRVRENYQEYSITMAAGDIVTIPAGVWHQLVGFGDYFRFYTDAGLVAEFEAPTAQPSGTTNENHQTAQT